MCNNNKRSFISNLDFPIYNKYELFYLTDIYTRLPIFLIFTLVSSSPFILTILDIIIIIEYLSLGIFLRN